MCDHHHAARHILCPQCDLLVALPQLEHRQKAVCPRCGTTLTTSWDAPRQRPTAYALVALFMLLLANLFPFVYMKVGGLNSEIGLLEIPDVLFSEDYASLGSFFLLFVQLVPAFSYARWAKGFPRADPVPPQNLGNGGNLSRRGAGELREAHGLRRYWRWPELFPLVYVLPAAAARAAVRGPTLAVGRYCANAYG
jgi:hypothetical protein